MWIKFVKIHVFVCFICDQNWTATKKNVFKVKEDFLFWLFFFINSKMWWIQRFAVDLNISLWSLFQPSFDLFQIDYTVYDTLQVRMLIKQINFNHVIEIIQNTSKVNVSPSQLQHKDWNLAKMKIFYWEWHTRPRAKCPPFSAAMESNFSK